MYQTKLFSLKNKKIIVVGGSRGIGKQISLAYLKFGAKVIVLGRSKINLKQKNYNYLQCDINNIQEVNKAYIFIKKNFNKIDVIVNCAGISLSSNLKANDDKNFEKIINNNLISIYRTTSNLISLLNKKSSIINVSSIASYSGFPNNPGYITSKSGLSGLTRSLAYDLSPSKIRVNNLVLGYIKTNMTKDSYYNKKKYKIRQDNTLLKRWGKLSDVVGPAIFLASDSSAYITGSDIIVDGGWLIKGL